jgi:hypothetical protein
MVTLLGILEVRVEGLCIYIFLVILMTLNQILLKLHIYNCFQTLCCFISLQVDNIMKISFHCHVYNYYIDDLCYLLQMNIEFTRKGLDWT